MQVGADEVHEFLPGIFVFEESPCELGRGGHGVLLLDAAHGHAKVLGLNDNGNSKGVQYLLEAVLDLRGQSLLKLQPAGKALHHAWDFAEPHDGSVGDVPDMRLSEEGQEVVFAHGVDFDVLHHYNLFVVFVEQGTFEDGLGILTVAVREEVHSFGHAHRGLQQPLSFRIFA